ncbi:mannosyltransferase putative-domain-containing protein, partial [Blyttiomyces helicus]
LKALEANMYPWIRGGKKFTSAAHLLASFSGRGIVMATGEWHFRFARHCIHSLRIVGSTLPIEVYYAGSGDLAAGHIAELNAIDGVTVLDLADFFDLEIGKVNGWAVKPFAMLASRFREMIFIDADALFFQPPEVMFDFEGYLRTGATFFMDRTMGAGATATRDFFSSFVPYPSDYARAKGRIMRMLSVHEGESGVIVYDKVINFHGLLAAVKMNAAPWRDVMYKVIHGDKESYWMAQELMNLRYEWAPGGGGTVGFLEDLSVCGGLYHPDENYRPLWWNGGVTMNKYTPEGKGMLNLTHWATDRDFDGMRWEWEQAAKPFCLFPKDPVRDIGELTPVEREHGRQFQEAWKRLEGPN